MKEFETNFVFYCNDWSSKKF